MKIKIIFSLFVLIFLIGIVIPAEGDAGEATTIGIDTTETIEVGETDITASGIEFVTKDNGNTLINFLNGGIVTINGIEFGNASAGSMIELNSSGDIMSADLTATKDKTVFTIGERDYDLLKGMRVKYENGKAIVYGDSGDSFNFKSSSSEESTNVKLIDNTIRIEDSESGSILTGNCNIGENKIIGIGENVGKVTVSGNGKISKVWVNTEATINGISHEASGSSLNIYYEEGFDASSHAGENYFNYGESSISLGGEGFTSSLGKENEAFGNMKTSKVVKNIGTKTRELEIKMEGGNLEISKDTAITYDLAFDINGEGDYTINNGREVISSKEGNIFVKANEDKEGLLYSYDLNINNEYTLESNIFKDKLGNILVNANKPWETAVLSIKTLDDAQVEKIKIAIKKETGVIPKDYTYLFDEENKETMVKWFEEATNSANQNVYGTEISVEELWTRAMLEGGANYKSGYFVYDYDNVGNDVSVYGSTIGLDNIGESGVIEKLKEDNFIPDNFEIDSSETMINEQYQETTTAQFYNIKDALTAFAGELASRKHVFETDFKEAYGEEEFAKLTDEEGYFWLTYYFNAGAGAGKGQLTGTKYSAYSSTTGEKVMIQGEGRSMYSSWTGAIPGSADSNIGIGKSAKYNSILSEATYMLVERLGIFDFL